MGVGRVPVDQDIHLLCQAHVSPQETVLCFEVPVPGIEEQDACPLMGGGIFEYLGGVRHVILLLQQEVH